MIDEKKVNEAIEILKSYCESKTVSDCNPEGCPMYVNCDRFASPVYFQKVEENK